MPVTLQTASEATKTSEQATSPVVVVPPRVTVPRRDRRRRIVGLLVRARWAGYRDPLFERPEIIEDDYYRFVNQPRG